MISPFSFTFCISIYVFLLFLTLNIFPFILYSYEAFYPSLALMSFFLTHQSCTFFHRCVSPLMLCSSYFLICILNPYLTSTLTVPLIRFFPRCSLIPFSLPIDHVPLTALTHITHLPTAPSPLLHPLYHNIHAHTLTIVCLPFSRHHRHRSLV